MKTLAVVNQKGGVGKTTTAISLGSLLAEKHGTALMIDLDPHASLSTYFGNNPEVTDSSSFELFKGAINRSHATLDSLVSETAVKNLFLLPASTHLATIERRGANVPGLGLVIRENLLKSAKTYDYVLIDTPPTLGILMINALAACDHVIIPVQTDYLAIRGLDLVVCTLDRVRRSRNWALPHLIVPTFYDRRTKASEKGLEELQQRYRRNLWDGVIPVDSGIRTASSEKIPYPQFNRRGRAAKAYARLVDDLLPLLLQDTPDYTDENSAEAAYG